MGETLCQAREEPTGALGEHLARYPLGEVVEVEDKGKVASVATRKIHGVEVHLHSFLISAVDRDAVVSFIPQPPYPRYPLHRRHGGHQSVLGWRDKYLAPPPPPYTVQIEMLNEKKHTRIPRKMDVQFQQDWSELVRGERKYKRVA
jgi:hypothetical protein